MLPLVHGAADPIDTLQSYVAVYAREEVQTEGLVRDLDGFPVCSRRSRSRTLSS